MKNKKLLYSTRPNLSSCLATFSHRLWLTSAIANMLSSISSSSPYIKVFICIPRISTSPLSIQTASCLGNFVMGSWRYRSLSPKWWPISSTLIMLSLTIWRLLSIPSTLSRQTLKLKSDLTWFMGLILILRTFWDSWNHTSRTTDAWNP